MNKQHYPFTLMPLPYGYNALEPRIDTLTMQLHHDRHLKTYVDNLNAALAPYPATHGMTLAQLILSAPKLPKALQTPVLHNAGGVWNHDFFFKHMAPGGRPPSDALRRLINRDFGSCDAFKAKFKEAALGVFGSGYAWLAPAGGRLRIVTTANQDTPIALGLRPIAGIDVWEHAYYLKHYNVRADYIDDWFGVAAF